MQVIIDRIRINIGEKNIFQNCDVKIAMDRSNFMRYSTCYHVVLYINHG